MTPIKKVRRAIDLTKARVRSEYSCAAERGVAAADCSADLPSRSGVLIRPTLPDLTGD